jgi:hypothetical protein
LAGEAKSLSDQEERGRKSEREGGDERDSEREGERELSTPMVLKFSN